MAVAALRRGKIKKIVLVRPAVEAGEHLGFLPGRPGGEDQPVSPSAARCPARPDGLRSDPPLHGQRPDRDRPAGLHAGTDPERRGDHPRRGSERHGPADEDVPDPDGPERADRGHRRHHAGRPAAGDRQRPGRRGRSGCGRSRASAWSCSTSRTSSGIRWCRRSSTPTKVPSRPGQTGIRRAAVGGATADVDRLHPTVPLVRPPRDEAGRRSIDRLPKPRRRRRGTLRRGMGPRPVDHASSETLP